MKYLNAELPIALALITLGLGLGFEHAVITHGGVWLWSSLLLILTAIIGVAFRISHHAEILAMRFGEPYGTLILTLAAVSVEVVILIVLLHGDPNPTLARDTVFSAVMFDINGILGLAAIAGGLKHGSAKYNLDSANSYIALGASLATVLLTLPVIEALALFNGERIVMALTPIQGGMLLLTFLTVMNNLHDGETNAIEGVSHFVLFAAFIAVVVLGLI